MRKYIFDVVQELVAEDFGITKNDLNVLGRKRDAVDARQIIFYIVKGLTDKNSYRFNLSHLGYMLNKNHATVIHSIKNVNDLRFSNKVYKDRVDRLYQKCSESLSGVLNNIGKIELIRKFYLSLTDLSTLLCFVHEYNLHSQLTVSYFKQVLLINQNRDNKKEVKRLVRELLR